jgi:hypothetical protein
MVVSGFSLRSHADPAAYSAKDIRGQVVDDATGDPLEGVIIVAQWELAREVIPGLVNKSYGDTLRIIEGVSDKQGRYQIPGWGPMPRPPLLHLEEGDPGIVFFKPGYYPRAASNEIRGQYSRNSLRESQWDGKTVRLRKFTGQPQEYVEQNGRFRDEVKVTGKLDEYVFKIRSVQGQLGWQKKSDEWRNYPRLVIAIKEECERLKAAMARIECPINSEASLWGGAKSVNQFLEKYQK